MITRNIVNKNIKYDGKTYNDLCLIINRWKSLLLSKGVKKGDNICVGILTVNINHIALLLAAGELGLVLFVLSKPLYKETIHATKIAFFGPMQHSVVEKELMLDPTNRLMLETYGGKITLEHELESVDDVEDNQPWEVTENDNYLLASTSGTTSQKPIPIYFSHKNMEIITKRNGKIYDYKNQDVIIQSVNMHHASSILSVILPTLRYVDTHYGITIIPDFMRGIQKDPKYFTFEKCARFMIDHKVTNIMFGSKLRFQNLLDALKVIPEFHTLTYKIRVNISGFALTPEFYEDAKKYPIEFWSHYGAVDLLPSPLFLNIVTDTSQYMSNYLGVMPDNFSNITFYEDAAYVDCSSLGIQSQKINDGLEQRDKDWYHLGRKNQHILYSDEVESLIREQFGDFSVFAEDGAAYIVVWDYQDNLPNIDSGVLRDFNFLFLKKEDFHVDTKVDMNQLLAYVKYHTPKPKKLPPNNRHFWWA